MAPSLNSLTLWKNEKNKVHKDYSKLWQCFNNGKEKNKQQDDWCQNSHMKWYNFIQTGIPSLSGYDSQSILYDISH